MKDDDYPSKSVAVITMRIAHVNVTVYGRFAPLTLKVRDHVLITTTQKTVSTLPEQTGIGIGTGPKDLFASLNGC